MITLQDVDVALARAEQLMPQHGRSPQQDEQLVCLSNARGMLRELGRDATATLERMGDTLDSLRDIAQGR